MDIRASIELLEAKSQHQISQVKLPYSRGGLSPVISSATMDFHYGKLYKGYVERYNNNTGDKSFNEAGAFLHELWFTQFQRPSSGNRPTGRILDLINRNWDNFVDFKTAMREESMKIQGSGWIYLSRSGTIKQIQNHSKRTDIAILIDMWEHSFQNDYHSDKKKYVDSLWRIINWSVINQRL